MSQDKTIKVWKVSRTSSAGMVVSEDSAILVGSKDVAVIASDKGVTLVGPISLVADAASIRRGGLFTGLNDFLDMIPSTIVTPIPKQIPVPPIHGLMGLTKDVAFFRSLLV
jgi:hypothetical protein